MGKTRTTRYLEHLLYKRMDFRKDFGCHEVTLGWFGKERVDFMLYTGSREFICFEVKVSKSDFYSKSKVSFVGNKNYYVMPNELFEQVKQDIPSDIGCYVPINDQLFCIKRCKKRVLGRSKEILLSSLLRSMQREWLKSIGGYQNWAEKTIGNLGELKQYEKKEGTPKI